MNLVTQYAKLWRFDLNQSKSAVLVFGKKRAPRNLTWRLGGGTIRQLTRYKYLGIELTRTLDWSPHIKNSIARAKRSLTQVMAMGVTGGFLSPKLASHLWSSLVRPVLDYGSEVWGEALGLDLEKLQLEMGRKILRGGKRLTGEVVRGELGGKRTEPGGTNSGFVFGVTCCASQRVTFQE